MKKAFLLSLVMIFAVTTKAQEGSFYLGTSALNLFGTENVDGFNFSTSPITGYAITAFDDNHTATYGIAPELGYFISDDKAVGVSLFYTHSGIDDGNDANTFGINPYFRYYASGIGEKFKIYLQAGFTYAKTETDIEGAFDLTYFDIMVRPGISYNFTDIFAINATFGKLGYSKTSIDKIDDSINEFGLNLDTSSLRFGFTVSF